MSARLGPWAAHYQAGAFAPQRGVALAGVSGGRTSGMMAALLAPSVILTFQNTGCEDARTLDFLHELDGMLGGRLVWMEYRPPAVKGARPRDGRFAVVTYATASRRGEPFEMMLEALAAYRATKGQPPVEPWARQRLCTAYLKRKVQEKYAASLGLDAYDAFVGLRADEPHRVAALLGYSSGRTVFRCPLHAAGITERDVREFWSHQAFDLDLPPERGNCTGCFLKDQGDLARVLMRPDAGTAWWIKMQDAYPRFGGAAFPGYRQLAQEGPVRLSIEAMLRAGGVPTERGPLSPERFRLVVLQERRRLAVGAQAISCACETRWDDEED